MSNSQAPTLQKARTPWPEPEMRAAIARRDPTWDGRFVYAVITTGVFCRPTCAARPARPENLRFFPDGAAAQAAGFRPCKRCRPTETARDIAALTALARHIEAHADETLTAADLAARAGLTPAVLNRAFRAAFGVSPKAFQDAARLGRLKTLLRSGDGVAGAIFEAGYGSTSRVYGAAAGRIGMTPSAYRSGGAGETIAYACRPTALGPLMMGATGRGVCFVMFGADEASLLAQLQDEFPAATLAPSAACKAAELDAWMTALDGHLAGSGPRPDLPLDLQGTAFQIKVWRFLLSVTEGSVVSYGEVAAGIGAPKAVRAAASACGANRIGVLVPCHRVLRGDGGLGGYRWGMERKRALLDAERRRSAGT